MKSERKETFKEWVDRIRKIAPNLDYTKNDGTYNYRGAYEGGLEPEFNSEDKKYHLGSRNPITGEVLKSEKHLSFNEFLKEENKLGYNVYKAKDGKVYSHPNNQIKDDNVLEYVTYGGTLEPAVATAEAPEWAKYSKEYIKNNPFNIDEYVENRFSNPVGREVIEKIDPRGWRKKLRREGLERRRNAISDYASEQLLKK